MEPTIHIIGAGLSGLAAGVRLASAGVHVRMHEAAPQAGGRCRSFYDAATGLVIDNGNHLILSGNESVLRYARLINSEACLQGPGHAELPFVELDTGRRWMLQINDGRIPFWMLRASKRVPDTKISDYSALTRLLWARDGELVGDKIECDGPLYRRLVRPLLLATMNIDPPLGSAGLASAIVRRTLLAGGRACRPLIAREGLSNVLVEPAVKLLRENGAMVRFNHELHSLETSDNRITSLNFGDGRIAIGPSDKIVVAVPARQAAKILPGIKVPTKFVSILNAHFRYEPPPNTPPILGVVNGLVDWIFSFKDRLSITISGADRLMNACREDLAQDIWDNVCAATGASGDLPPWQIVRERRATFAATPEQNALRPDTMTQWQNLFLAGDWTATGLPSTIEGSISSGDKAADQIIHELGHR